MLPLPPPLLVTSLCTIPTRLTLQSLCLHAGGHNHGCGRHIPVVVASSKLRRLLDNMFGGMGGPNNELLQGKKVAVLAKKDLQETESHSADYLAPKPGHFGDPGRDRHLLQFGSGPSSYLKQTKAASDLTWKDLEQTMAEADRFAQSQKGSRRTGGDRRMLQFGSGPSSYLKQTKAANDLTWKDLEQTMAEADRFAQPPKGSGRTRGDRRLLQFGSGPSSYLKQTKAANDLTWKDLEQTMAEADRFAQPRKGNGRAGGDRRLLGKAS
jgi:DUF971 family protein